MILSIKIYVRDIHLQTVRMYYYRIEENIILIILKQLVKKDVTILYIMLILNN